jgi:hypothetical protein
MTISSKDGFRSIHDPAAPKTERKDHEVVFDSVALGDRDVGQSFALDPNPLLSTRRMSSNQLAYRGVRGFGLP